MGKKKPTAAKQPTESQAGSVSSATQSMASMAISQKSLSLFPAKPPRQGTQRGPGTPVDLITNMFKISLMTKQPIYRFDVLIDLMKDGEPQVGVDKLPRKLNKDLRKMALRAALDEWHSRNPRKDLTKKKYLCTYDNNASVVYTLFNIFPDNSPSSTEMMVSLPLDSIFEGKLTKRPETFKVKFVQSSTSVIDIDKLFNYCRGIGSDITRVQECIRAMNVILHGEIINIDRFVVTPFSVFDFEGKKTPIGPKVLLCEGFSMSARPTASGLMLNVANSFNAFHEETDLISMLQKRFSVRDLSKPLPPYVVENLMKEIRNKQIEARHINYGSTQRPHYRKYRVTSIEGDCLHKFTIVDKVNKTSKEITIKDYFSKEYKCNIKYPKLQCIVDKGRRIPMEVCHLIDRQRVTRKMTGEETAATITAAALKPEVHFGQIYKHVDTINKHSQPLKDFGLSFDTKPIEVTGRELAPTLLGSQRNQNIVPNNGQYNVQRERFLRPARIGKWALAFLGDTDTRAFGERYKDLGVARFSDLYKRAAALKGMEVGQMQPMRQIMMPNDMVEVKKKLQQEFTEYNRDGYDHVIFLLSDHCVDYMYRYLQYLETLRLGGKPNQTKFTRVTCVKLSNYSNKILRTERPDMFISNLLLKYNTKLGGINFSLTGNPAQNKYLQPGYIFISVDVCHPAPGDKLAQSVAAAVGMWDLNTANRSYRTCIRVQRKARQNNSTVEDVGEIDKMFQDILRAYYDNKGKQLPTNIVILRDGVSEGQLKIVLDSELRKIYANLEQVYSINKKPVPKVACMVVQKRHKVRFMRKKPLVGPRGSDYNIQPGTVVDSDITHPTDFTFYLAPHKAIQGTSKAAHIYVIHDTIGFSQDEAQSMIHALSYLSPRCTKSTSIPTPVNLADRAAERGKNLVICWQEENMRGGAKKRGQGGDAVGIDEQKLIELNDYLQNIGDANYRNTLFYI